MRGCSRILSVISASLLVLAAPASSYADTTTREFVTSCTYGVMAGTLVGVASLAFTDKPSDSLNRVARGASLGLYTGILLGIYVVYIVPGMEKEEEDPVAAFDNLPVIVSPTLSENNTLDGARADWRILRF